MTRHPLGLTLAALLTATVAFAQSGGGTDPSGTQPETQLGVQARKGVDLAAFQERQRGRMMQADTDRDGRIGLAEFTAWRSAHPGKARADGRQPNPERQFRRLDANSDGFLTPDEIDAASAKRFARLDADHDGSITRDEHRQNRKP